MERTTGKRGTARSAVSRFAKEFDNAVPCPWCESRDTSVRSPFGGTVSEIMMQCNACGSGFGWMKWQGLQPGTRRSETGSDEK